MERQNPCPSIQVSGCRNKLWSLCTSAALHISENPRLTAPGNAGEAHVPYAKKGHDTGFQLSKVQNEVKLLYGVGRQVSGDARRK